MADPATRTTCRECNDQLWGPDEALGLCGRCQLREDEQTGAFDDPCPEDAGEEP